MKNIFIVAEVGVNHNGSLKIAKKLIDAAKSSGANAVKFQTFHSETLVTKKASKASYQKKRTLKNESQYQMLKKLELSKEKHKELLKYCKKKRIEFMSTAFDINSLEFLSNELNLKKYKISSSEITNTPLLIEFARKKRHIILSTGMSNIKEIELALGAIAFGFLKLSKPGKEKFIQAYQSKEGKKFLNKYVSLLHCTSDYPAKINNLNLNCIKTLKNKFRLNVGYSDHSLGTIASLIAVAMGATIIEKHITLDKNLPGPDHSASLDIEEFRDLVKQIKIVEKIKGSYEKKPTKNELKIKKLVRKSIHASKKIKKGDLFSKNNITTKRPGNGLDPSKIWDFMGRESSKDFNKDEKIS